MGEWQRAAGCGGGGSESSMKPKGVEVLSSTRLLQVVDQ